MPGPAMAGDRSRLDGRTAVITGGNGFLGQRWVGALLEAGATVVSVDVAPSGAELRRDERLRHEEADITDRDAVAALARRLAESGLVVDVLVNNAAIDAPVGASG